jgi:hypothetical protein
MKTPTVLVLAALSIGGTGVKPAAQSLTERSTEPSLVGQRLPADTLLSWWRRHGLPPWIMSLPGSTRLTGCSWANIIASGMT